MTRITKSTQTRAWTIAFLFSVVAAILTFPLAAAAQSDAADGPHAEDAASAAAVSYEKANDRIFGVLPNYRTVDGSVPFSPLTPSQKLNIATKDSFDWPSFGVTGSLALMYQATNQSPQFGHGVQGFAKQYAASFGDQVIGNMMTEGFVPSLTHEDPRYFRVGSGSTGSRLKSALLQMVVARTDSGRMTFNASEWLGNAAAVGISNAYYSQSRTLSDNAQRFAMQIANDAMSDVLKEFWPDIKHRFFERH